LQKQINNNNNQDKIMRLVQNHEIDSSDFSVRGRSALSAFRPCRRLKRPGTGAHSKPGEQNMIRAVAVGIFDLLID
jgi:hypothetical protein